MTFEEVLRQQIEQAIAPLVKEIQELKSQLGQHSIEPVITPKEAAKILKMGRNAIYELAKHPTFPAYRDGDKIKIFANRLIPWYEEYLKRNNQAS